MRDAHGVYTILTINFPYFIYSYLTFMLVYGYGCTYSVFVHLYTYITSINQFSYLIFKLAYMNIDAHTACLCICIHICDSKSTQNKNILHLHFSTFNSVQIKYTNIFIKQNRIEARLRPDGIWLK